MSIILTLLLLSVNLLLGVLGDISSPLVELPLGTIEGHIRTSVKGRSFFAFEGVPYAKPPVGKLRFKNPEPVEKWLGVWQAKTIYKCFQNRHVTVEYINEAILGEEDCLYLNIYTSNLNDGKLRDVIVFIHGGAYMFNYGAFQGPDLLLDHEVVYVNFNYRLGPLGFLSTEDDEVSGNMGIKDQILALKWIQENIKYFGGNPESVTITGNSAGAASVHFHYLIPESKGLFHRGYSQSGCSLNPWVLMENPLEKTKKLADSLGCPTENTKQIVSCLQQRTAKEILGKINIFQPWLYNPFSPFGVVVETWSKTPLLPNHPYKLLENKQVADVPWIVTHTDSEGLYPASEFFSSTEYLEYIDQNWNTVIPFILDYNFTVEHKSLDTVSQAIRKFYLGNKSVSRETFMEFLKVITDRLYIADIEKSSRLHAAAVNSPVYYGYFTYRGAHSRSEFRANSDANLGAAHGDDMSYVLKNNLDTMSTVSDKKMTELLVNFWVNYAQSGVPQISTIWQPMSKRIDEDISYLNIESPVNIKMKKTQSLGNSKFWKNLQINENDKLFTTRSINDEL